MNNLYKVLSDGSIEACPDVIVTPAAKIAHPTEQVANKFGYWPLKETPAPEAEENQIVIDLKYGYADAGNGQKEVVHNWAVRTIVDNPPELAEDEEILRDYWEDIGDERVHIYVIVNVIDVEPEIPEGMTVVGFDWEIDEEALTKTKVYKVRTKIDNPPELEEGQKIVEDWWEDDGVNYTHCFDIRTIVDNPPELAENEFIFEDHWTDDGETRTHVYDVWTKVDEMPEEAPEGMRLIDLGWENNFEDKKLVHNFVMKKIVDEKPEDDPEGNFTYVFDYEEEREEEIVMVYRRVDRVWRIFSKLKLELALFKLGMLSKFDEFIDSVMITNEQGEEAPLRRFYDQANELAENDPLFKPYLSAAIEKLEFPADQVEEFLNSIVA